MKTLLLAMGLAAAAFATPTCLPGTAADYSFNGPCTVGSGSNQLTISDVTWSSLGGVNYKHVPDTDIFLTPLVGPGGNFMGLNFTPLNNAFIVDASHTMVGTLRYIVDPPPPILDGYGVSLDPTGYSSLAVSIYYGTKTPPQTQPPTLTNLSFGVSHFDPNLYTLDTGVHPIPPSNYLDIKVTIQIGNGTVTNPTIPATSGGGQSTVYSSASLVVPEPAAFGFVGIGLTALLALRRRQKRS